MRLSVFSACCVLVAAVWAQGACDGNDPGTGADATVTTSPEDTSTTAETTPVDTSVPDIGNTTENKDLRNGNTARVGHIYDGDTVDVWVGTLAPKKYIIRMLGFSAPECFKTFVSGTYSGNACTSDDELYGVASYQALKAMLEGKTVKVTCDVGGDDWCKQDDFDRYLAYLEIDGKDAATEMARGGHGFSYVEFASSKRAAICAAEYDARDAKRGIWALGSLAFILDGMSSYTRNWYEDHHDQRCDQALGL